MDRIDDAMLASLAQKLANKMGKAGQRLSVAESCTGGWLAKILTDLSGSSVWFDRGFVTYSNQSKNEMLGVSEATLEETGAVSQQTVEAMAEGALLNSNADISVAISGIAGPGGGTKDKPVGLVWFGWATSNPADKKHSMVNSISQQFSGNRDEVRRQAVAYALNGLLKQLTDLK